MSILVLIAVALFLPLFPLSMVFSAVFARARWVWLRALLLLAWPQIGLSLVFLTQVQLPSWLLPWGLATAALYALRLLTLRDFNAWIAFIALSAYALLWIGLDGGASESMLRLQALGFSLPLVVASAVAGALERRLGAAYSGLHRGLVQRLPRLAGVLALSVLAAIATPLFPSFFAMLATLYQASALTSIGVVTIWLLWSWAAARLLEGFLPGVWTRAETPADLGMRATWGFGVVLLVLVLVATVLSSMGLEGGV